MYCFSLLLGAVLLVLVNCTPANFAAQRGSNAAVRRAQPGQAPAAAIWCRKHAAPMICTAQPPTLPVGTVHGHRPCL